VFDKTAPAISVPEIRRVSSIEKMHAHLKALECIFQMLMMAK